MTPEPSLCEVARGLERILALIVAKTPSLPTTLGPTINRLRSEFDQILRRHFLSCALCQAEELMERAWEELMESKQ